MEQTYCSEEEALVENGNGDEIVRPTGALQTFQKGLQLRLDGQDRYLLVCYLSLTRRFQGSRSQLARFLGRNEAMTLSCLCC